MRQLAAGVCIVTVGTPGDRRGLTATAICSLSDNPPMILACVNKSAGAHDLILQERRFAVNVLAADQISIAKCFAGQTGRSGEKRFEEWQWQTSVTGAPILVDALINIDCALAEEKSMSTHTILLGKVEHCTSRADASALLYWCGSYKEMQ